MKNRNEKDFGTQGTGGTTGSFGTKTEQDKYNKDKGFGQKTNQSDLNKQRSGGQQQQGAFGGKSKLPK